jgi:hypothetical protein
MLKKLHISKIISNLEYSIFKLYNLVMCNLYTKFVKFLEICKHFSKDLVTESGNIRRKESTSKCNTKCKFNYNV